MKNKRKGKRILFDLNHPADFHFFKNLIRELEKRGYRIRIVARDKDCLHALLKHEGMKFTSRGKGSHRLIGKYLFAAYNMGIIFWQLLIFKPSLTISLASPYLILISRFFSIETMTYIDTDINPRIISIIRKAHIIFTPSSFPLQFHEKHYYLDTLKELAYLEPDTVRVRAAGDPIFFRITRTDSIHHTHASRLDLQKLIQMMNELCQDHQCIISSEETSLRGISGNIKEAGVTTIHEEMKQCCAFWGNSATMVTEAAVLGIPAIFVGAEKFAYLEELEKLGMIFCFRPGELESSWDKLHSLINLPELHDFDQRATNFFWEKINPITFLIWFIENLPQSARIMDENQDYQYQFKF